MAYENNGRHTDQFLFVILWRVYCIFLFCRVFLLNSFVVLTFDDQRIVQQLRIVWWRPHNVHCKMVYFIFRFGRKEKEIAETKSELLQSENMRYQQRLEYVEKQLQDTKQSLEKEKERTKTSAVDDKEHDEIMRKVELLAEMEKMNKVLSSEKENLQNKIKQTESQVHAKFFSSSASKILKSTA